MAISAKSQQALDDAVAVLTEDGYTIWGLIIPRDDDCLYPFGNTGEEIEVLIHNLEEGARALRETLNISTHEA